MPGSMSEGSSTTGTRRAPVDHLLSALRGSGQVIFMADSRTGLVNLLAFAWGAWAGGTRWSVALGAVLGVLVATATAHALAVDEAERRAGLYGFNGLLVGAGIATFLVSTPLVWAVLVLACAASTLVTHALARLLAPWRLPFLTFPFILTTWLVLLAAHALPGLSQATLPAALAADSGTLTAPWFLRAALASVGQVFFVDNAVSGALFLLALALASRRAALLAAAGALLAVACALLLGADRGQVVHGLWGYSAVLTAVALGAVFMRPGARTLAYAGAATVLTVLVQGASFSVAGTLGMPALTFPFVLVTWLFLLAGWPAALR